MPKFSVFLEQTEGAPITQIDHDTEFLQIDVFARDLGEAGQNGSKEAYRRFKKTKWRVMKVENAT